MNHGMGNVTEIMDETDSSDNENVNDLPMCPYGSTCYRKNPNHFKEYRHPPKSVKVLHVKKDEDIEIRIEIGHKCIPKSEITLDSDGNKYHWTVFVRGINGKKIENFVKKIIFHLPEQFPLCTLVVEEPPFNITESSCNSVSMSIELHFKSDEHSIIKFNYDVSLKENSFQENTRFVKMTFQNPTSEFRQLLLNTGGDIVQEPDSSTSINDQQAPSSSNQRKRVICEKSDPTKDEYDVFGTHCASKLRKVDNECATQKVIAEKLISEILYHAQMKSLTTESSILGTKEKTTVGDKPFLINVKEEVN